MRSETGDLVAAQSGHLQRMPVGRRPDRLHHVAEVEAAGREGPVAEDRERGEARPRRRRSPPRAGRAGWFGHAVDARRTLLEHCTPSRTEHRLARLRLVGRSTAVADRRRASSGSAASRRSASASAVGSPGGTSSALSSWTSSSRARGVSAVTSGVPQASAWKALFGITRCALSEVPKIPSARRPGAAPRAALVLDPAGPTPRWRPPGEQRFELAAADDAEPQPRGQPRRGEDRFHAVKRDQLAHEESGERLLRRPARTEDPLLGADEGDLDASGRRSASSAR